jgi:hypothetical protein
MSDHQAVCETLYRYAYALDNRDWVLYRSIFADEVDFDFSTYHGRPAVRMRADDLVASAEKLFAGFSATQHTMSNPIVEIDGESARCSMYIQAAHSVDPDPEAPWFTMGGHYEDHLIRHDGGWLLDGVCMKLRWTRGDKNIMRTAVAHSRKSS